MEFPKSHRFFENESVIIKVREGGEKVTDSTHQIKREIEQTRLVLEEKYALAMTAARKILEKHEELTVAEENRDVRGASKDIARHEIAEGYFISAVKKFFIFLGGYDDAVENLLKLYDELAAVGCAKEAKRARAEAERIEGQERYRRDRLFDIIKYVSGVEAMYSEYSRDKGKVGKKLTQNLDLEEDSILQNDEDILSKEFDSAAFDSDITENRSKSVAEEKQGYGASAINIDISKIVEESVAVALSKFNSVLEKRIDSAVAEYSGSPKSAQLSDDVLKMHSELVDFELEIASKLSDLTNKLKGISKQMIDIGDAYIKLSDMQKELSEKQMKFSEEQSALSLDIEKNYEIQREIAENQTVISEGQSAISEQQSELVTLSSSIMDTSKSISKSTSEILSAQKEIYELQHTAIDSGKKNLDIQRALTAKQMELTSLQKSALAEHKLLKRKK